MHGDMAGLDEVRVRGLDCRTHRLFCVLERDATHLGGPSIVCIDGLSKPVREAARPWDYRRVIELRGAAPPLKDSARLAEQHRVNSYCTCDSRRPATRPTRT